MDLKECPHCGKYMLTVALYPSGWHWVCTSVECGGDVSQTRVPVNEGLNERA